MQLNELIYKTLRTVAGLSLISVLLMIFFARWSGYLTPASLVFYVGPLLWLMWLSLDLSARVKELNQ